MWTEGFTAALETFGDPLVDGFLGVGVLVAALLLTMNVARARWGVRCTEWLLKFPATGPALAATLSIPPGCSGAVMIVSLYAQKQVTFGAVVAALLSTMGDSAWLFIAANPILALQLKLLFFVVGLAGGYLVDQLKITPLPASVVSRKLLAVGVVPAGTRLHSTSAADASAQTPSTVRGVGTDSSNDEAAPIPTLDPKWWARVEPCCVTDLAPNHQSTPPRRSVLISMFWVIVALGLMTELPVLFQVVDEESIPGVWGVSGYMLIGLVGFVLAGFVAVSGRRHRRDCHCTDSRSWVSILSHTAYQSASIILTVGILSFVIVSVTEATGFDPIAIPFAGAVGIVVAAALGLLPFCGMEIVIAGLFLAGGMPLPALLAYLVSHGGAGLLALVAVNRRAALLSTVLTGIPALAIGFAVLALL